MEVSDLFREDYKLIVYLFNEIKKLTKGRRMRTVIATDFTEPKPWWMKQQFPKTVPTLRCRINYGCQMKRQTKR